MYTYTPTYVVLFYAGQKKKIVTKQVCLSVGAHADFSASACVCLSQVHEWSGALREMCGWVLEMEGKKCWEITLRYQSGCVGKSAQPRENVKKGRGGGWGGWVTRRRKHNYTAEREKGKQYNSVPCEAMQVDLRKCPFAVHLSSSSPSASLQQRQWLAKPVLEWMTHLRLNNSLLPLCCHVGTKRNRPPCVCVWGGGHPNRQGGFDQISLWRMRDKQTILHSPHTTRPSLRKLTKLLSHCTNWKSVRVQCSGRLTDVMKDSK